MKHERLHSGADTLDLRRSNRSHALLSACLDVEGTAVPIRLRNISTTGALVDVPCSIQVGAAVTLRRMQVAVQATVARVEEHRVGLRFDEPLCHAKLRLLKLGRAQLRSSEVNYSPEDGDAGKDRYAPVRRLKPTLSMLEMELSKELLLASALLGRSIEPLSKDFPLLPKVENYIRDADFVVRLLRNISLIMSSADKKAAITQIDMAALEGRLRGVVGK
ncbi:MAG TPA: PilZ domain-containing protein [Allosphingosinicella sp.]|uniref:PilZ domain-containing protein n=1 Tax=Allosphingosinicella sp. TaxID=2823234 RepID=UPI002ED85B4A